ncbi:MAG: DUF1653 domain-containing protein [Clostridiales bacterium]|nr:DUF1653 domain-containing protein [Clostridiales bacterium]
MAQGNPMPGEKYLHFKNRLYQVISVAYHSETMEKYVVYQALYGDFKTYIRPYEMFISEVDHEKYPDVTQRYRFRYLEDADDHVSGEAPGEHDDTEKRLSDDPSEGESPLRTSPTKTPLPEFSPETESPAGSLPETGCLLKAKTEASPEDHTEGHLNPWLDKILDARDFDEKYKIVCDMHNDVTDRLIDDIAVVMDLAIPEGDLKSRYDQLKYCLRTRQRYEMGRLRP